MIQFDIGLLSRRVRGTIEEMNVAALNFLWIGEFSAVIGQKNSEYERKALAKLFSEPIETGNDGSGGIGLKKASMKSQEVKCRVSSTFLPTSPTTLSI